MNYKTEKLIEKLKKERDHYKRLLEFIGDTNQSICQLTMPTKCIEEGGYMLEPAIEAAIRMHERLKGVKKST